MFSSGEPETVDSERKRKCITAQDLRKTRLCKSGRAHASDKTCNFAHCLVELRVAPNEATKDWAGNKGDRWIGQVLTDEQVKRILKEYGETQVGYT